MLAMAITNPVMAKGKLVFFSAPKCKRKTPIMPVSPEIPPIFANLFMDSSVNLDAPNQKAFPVTINRILCTAMTAKMM